jgi:lactate dehydrogenase-like 2-hydroxyacid dehydrogenase
MSARPRLLITLKLVQTLVAPPADEFDMMLWDSDPDGVDALLAREGKGVEVLLCAGMEDISAKRLALLPDLKLIAVMAAGVAGIDLDYVRTHGVAVTNAGDQNASDVADFALALFLAHRREIVGNDLFVRENKWLRGRTPLGRSIGDERVGVVGLGNIGRAVAKRLEPFGCEIAWWGRTLKPGTPWPRLESLEDLSKWATTLIVAVAGAPETRGLVTAAVIDALGPDGLIVNVSRGFVIDEPAMVAALKEGRLGGAALDVFDEEPIAGSSWADVPNILTAPHVAGSTQAAIGRVTRSCLRNIRAHFAGQPLEHRLV